MQGHYIIAIVKTHALQELGDMRQRNMQLERHVSSLKSQLAVRCIVVLCRCGLTWQGFEDKEGSLKQTMNDVIAKTGQGV